MTHVPDRRILLRPDGPEALPRVLEADGEVGSGTVHRQGIQLD